MKAKQSGSSKLTRNNESIRAMDWLLPSAALLVVVAIAAFVLTGANRRVVGTPAATPVPALAAEAPGDDHDHGAEVSVARITPVELRSAIDRDEAVVIDVRDLDSYAAGHVPGAMHIPLSFLESQVQYLPRGKTIVAYCT